MSISYTKNSDIRWRIMENEKKIMITGWQIAITLLSGVLSQPSVGR